MENDPEAPRRDRDDPRQDAAAAPPPERPSRWGGGRGGAERRGGGSRAPVRWLRRLLLLALLGVVAAVGALYWFGRSGAPQPRPATDSETVRAGEGVTTVGRGFEYTHYRQGQEAFSLRAHRTVEDRESTVFLEGVALTVHEAEGGSYDLSAERARYNRERQEALLEGDVRLQGSAGIRLQAERLTLGQEGRLLTSDSSVVIYYGDLYRATGDRFRVHVPEDLFLLIGNATIDDLPAAPPFHLESRRLVFERKRQLLRAEGGVLARHGGSQIEALSLNAFLTDDLSAIRFLRARWQVRGRTVRAAEIPEGMAGPPPANRMELTGRSLALLMRPEGSAPDNVELEGSPAEPAMLRTEGEGGRVRSISAGYLASNFRPDGTQVVEAYGEPEIVEHLPLLNVPEPGVEMLPPEPARRLSGGRGRAEILPGGELGWLQMVDGVDYRDERVEVRGERARFHGLEGRGRFIGGEALGGEDDELLGDLAPAPRGRLDEDLEEAAAGAESGEGTGGEGTAGEGETGEVDLAPLPPPPPDRQPVPRVTLVSERGELVAPEVRYDRGEGVVEASGGVSAVLRERLDLVGAPADAGPTRVEAREAYWRDEPRGVLFRQEVRAWQGESVLLAEWLRGDQEEGGRKVTAGGGVRTVMVPEPTPERPAGTPLTVTAQNLTYLEGDARVIYEGQVRTEDQGRRLASRHLELILGPERRVERLVALGEVRLEDSATGKTATARRAVYRPEVGEVELHGEPARVEDAQGGVVEAPVLTYDLESGRVRGGPGAGRAGEEGAGEEAGGEGLPAAEGAPRAPGEPPATSPDEGSEGEARGAREP